jgi:hypothetical protein
MDFNIYIFIVSLNLGTLSNILWQFLLIFIFGEYLAYMYL